MIKKFYTVIQGSKDKNDNGDEWDCGKYNTLKEAICHFNKIKKDTTGIEKIPGGYLETYVALSLYNDEDDCRSDNVMTKLQYKLYY